MFFITTFIAFVKILSNLKQDFILQTATLAQINSSNYLLIRSIQTIQAKDAHFFLKRRKKVRQKFETYAFFYYFCKKIVTTKP